MKICSCLFSFWEKLSNNANVFWKIIFRISWSLLLTFLTFHWLLSDSYLTLIWIFACRFAWLFAARKVRLIEKKNTPKSLYKFVVYNRNPAAEPDNWISKENPHPKICGTTGFPMAKWISYGKGRRKRPSKLGREMPNQKCSESQHAWLRVRVPSWLYPLKESCATAFSFEYSILRKSEFNTIIVQS